MIRTTVPAPMGGALALAATLSLTGCHYSAGTPTDTMSLLRAGSERACVASEVQQVLRGLILPKLADVSGEASAADKRKAIDSVALSFDTTTLAAADKAVGKISCSTTAHVHGDAGEGRDFRLSYDASPAAESSGGVVVSGTTSEVQGYAAAVAQSALDRQLEQARKAAEAAKSAQTSSATPPAEPKKAAPLYAVWRAQMLANGFRPAAIPHGGEDSTCGRMSEDEVCALYPETVDCIGMGPRTDTCRMAFVYEDGRFYVASTFGWDDLKAMTFEDGAWANAGDTKRIRNIIAGKAEDAD